LHKDKHNHAIEAKVAYGKRELAHAFKNGSTLLEMKGVYFFG
jgi:hypothetical protein